MHPEQSPPLTRAQESRVAIERMYITMRHLFNRGFYKPSGVSGEEIRRALLTLQPEIYGLVGDPQRVELDGLVKALVTFLQFLSLTSECAFVGRRT
jgi:hypothetical protein